MSININNTLLTALAGCKMCVASLLMFGAFECFCKEFVMTSASAEQEKWLDRLLFCLRFQVWFQNRRAKFRRNERAMLASKNASLLKSYSGDVTAVEQPIVPRPAPRPNDYLSWGSAAPYRYRPLTWHSHSSCVNTEEQLRLLESK